MTARVLEFKTNMSSIQRQLKEALKAAKVKRLGKYLRKIPTKPSGNRMPLHLNFSCYDKHILIIKGVYVFKTFKDCHLGDAENDNTVTE
jgi:hypothetical protein